MKCIYYDLRRAIAGRWFLAALIATIITIYLSVGRATYGLIGYLESYELFEDNSFWYAMSDLLALGMCIFRTESPRCTDFQPTHHGEIAEGSRRNSPPFTAI